MGEALYRRVLEGSAGRISPAASTRRSAVTATCCRTSCADCSRTARTRRSSIASAIRRSKSTTSSPTRSRAHARGTSRPRTRIPLPADLFAPERRNSEGVSLADQPAMAALDDAFARSARHAVDGDADVRRCERRTAPRATCSSRPTGGAASVPSSTPTGPPSIARWRRSSTGQPAWDARPARERAAILDRAADALESERATWVALLAREAGKTRAAAIAEVREAADFCRYYAAQARLRFDAPVALPSPTGEIEHAGAARSRRVRVHLAVEFSAGDLHRPGGRRARGRQRRRREARRTDAAHRRAGGSRAARGRRSARRARADAGPGRDDRRATRRRSAHRGRRLHRVDRGRQPDRARARRAFADRAADRRNRRAERDDRRQLGARRAGRRRRRAIGVRQRRTALLGAAGPLPAGGHRPARPRPARRRDGRARHRRSRATSRPTSDR